jgi:hypothetical protein
LRKQLEGWQPAKGSRYSADTVVDACGVCGARARLEVHHIRHQAEGGGHDPSNLVCLCAGCHDDHHAGRLTIERWEDTSAGKRLVWTRATAQAPALSEEITAWVREQLQLRVRVPTIQRMGRLMFGVELTEKAVRALR